MSRLIKRGATLMAERKVERAIGWNYIARRSLIALTLMGFVGASMIVSQYNILPILHVTVEGGLIMVIKRYWWK